MPVDSDLGVRTPTATTPPLIAARGAVVEYHAAGRALRAVDGVDLTLHPGEVVAVVGESGCGKTSLARALVGLQPLAAGSLCIDGQELVGAGRAAWRAARRRVQFVFQDPQAALDPRLTALEAVAEPLRCAGRSRRAALDRAAALLMRVGIEPAGAGRYPHAFSGGQRQRIVIARALAQEPAALICDEPVSALDISVRGQILNLLLELRDEQGLGLLLISHDLALVRHLANRVVVMYAGRVAEYGPARAVLDAPRHPYTAALMDAVPVPDPLRQRERGWRPIAGEAPSLLQRPAGCAFAPRCPRAQDDCRQPPAPSAGDHQRAAACIHPLAEAALGGT
jgi:oligopeptide/dipeptide ABC transporter ATP-binding protein